MEKLNEKHEKNVIMNNINSTGCKKQGKLLLDRIELMQLNQSLKVTFITSISNNMFFMPFLTVNF